jgi:hypothetical protein
MRKSRFAMVALGALALACTAFRATATSPAAPPPEVDHRDAFRHLPQNEFLTYLPEKYAACIPCHPRVVFEEEDFNVETNWRDVTMGKNLHGLHVYRQPDGVNCSVCHVWDEGAGKIAYGPKIKVTVTPKGGSCTPACHRPKKYDNAGRL